jgi:hypothetical protein
LKEPDLSNSLFIFVAHLRLHCFPNYLIKYIPFVISFLNSRKNCTRLFSIDTFDSFAKLIKIKCRTTIDKVPKSNE